MNFSTIRRVRSLIIVLLDCLFCVLIFSGVYFLRLNEFPDYTSVDLWLISTTFITTLYLSGTYLKEKANRLSSLPVRTFFICLVGGVICIAWTYLLGPSEFNEYFGRGVLPVGTVLFGICATMTRLVVNRIYHIQEKGIKLLYLGFSDSGDAFLKELKDHSEVRSITISTSKQPNNPDNQLYVFTSEGVPSLLSQNWQAVIIDPSHRSDKAEKAKLISLKLSGVPVISLPDYYEKNWYMVPINQIGDDWFLHSEGFSMQGNNVSIRIKQFIDVLLSLTLIVLSIPTIIICSVLIKVSSPGPLFFKQVRVGYQGKKFVIYKLRTMRDGAEENGAQWATSNDPRITKVGRFLRKSRLDELPQCWNVLKGDMSFVGPRPERPEFTQQLAKKIPYYDLRHMVKPGLTGWAQVIFPYGASEEDAVKKLQYELYYIKNQSLILDLNIMIRTAFTVFQRSGR